MFSDYCRPHFTQKIILERFTYTTKLIEVYPRTAFGSPPPSIGLDEEPETIKRVCCEAALTPRTIMTPT